MPHPCVIFDFDGVIADTERLHLAAYNHAAWPITPAKSGWPAGGQPGRLLHPLCCLLKPGSFYPHPF